MPHDNTARERPVAAAIDTLVSRLDGVRQFGDGWRANCPLGHTSRGSLSIAAGDDGCILLNCFSCHDTPGILAAIGLELGDLFPRRITHATTPQERRELRQRAKASQWAAALTVLARESDVCLIAAHDVAAARVPSTDDLVRLNVAVERIQSARQVFNDCR